MCDVVFPICTDGADTDYIYQGDDDKYPDTDDNDDYEYNDDNDFDKIPAHNGNPLSFDDYEDEDEDGKDNEDSDRDWSDTDTIGIDDLVEDLNGELGNPGTFVDTGVDYIDKDADYANLDDAEYTAMLNTNHGVNHAVKAGAGPDLSFKAKLMQYVDHNDGKRISPDDADYTDDEEEYEYDEGDDDEEDEDDENVDMWTHIAATAL